MAQMSFSLLVLYLTILAGLLGTIEARSRARAYLEAQCRSTLYADLCVRTLLPHANKYDLPSPQKIAQISLTTCLAKARFTKAYVNMVAKELNKTKNPGEYEVLEECLYQINNGVNQITQSVKELQQMGKDGEEKFGWHESNVQSWVGAALTDATACMDGFLGDKIGSKTKSMIKTRFLNVKELASNSLALLSRFTARHRASRAIKNPSWCKQTPHPEPCEYVLAGQPNYGPMKQNPDFINALLKVTQERAAEAESKARGLGPKCHNKLEKTAWKDCVQLYENTVQRINMTVDPKKTCSHVDMQTWLSTAVTNLETCKNGFEELGVGDYMLPLMNNNLSSLISNLLAMNKGGNSPNEPYRKGFPTWVKHSDRKLLESSNPSSQANTVVAQDGSGNYKTIGAAKSSGGRYVIYVKAGTYNEYIDVKSDNIMIVGDGMGKTVITGSKSVGAGSTSFGSCTMAVDGDKFIGRDFTVRNTAGPQNEQAVAVRSGSDLSVFYQCSLEGYQDTLYALSNRQFYKDCNIYGTVDFIFGNAAVVLQNCNILARDPPNKINTLTAQGRTDPNQNTGISIHNCRVTAASSLNGVKTYLGRPWKQYSRTVYMKTYLDGIVNPAGWLPWSGNFALDTLYYGEYMNTGPGSSTANRVKWKGYHVITSAGEAAKFAPGSFIAGGSWLPETGVPWTAAL